MYNSYSSEINIYSYELLGETNLYLSAEDLVGLLIFLLALCLPTDDDLF